ncbi:MAG: helix-hairpin-helix domain-containing protein [Candidatus Omnitrophica bacterium]|jgi:competence protein ComEA|nr:helix-hairpin-helix domain-containing protein [Candidatus Omnitrophota bacterium]
MFNLTRQERQVILFLLSVALFGTGVKLFSRMLPAKACVFEDITKINLNSADKNLLMAVPGIQDKIAQRIIEFRQEHSGFSSIEELRQIKGITNARLEKIKNYFSLR